MECKNDMGLQTYLEQMVVVSIPLLLGHKVQTTVRGIWKRNGEVFDVKHFENGTDGNQLLTTGTT